MAGLIAFGEVLWDVIDGVPYIGGAPFNLAAHAVRCGVEASLVSAVGADDLGQRALSEVQRHGVGAEWVKIDSQKPTGTVTVSISSEGQPSYKIHEGVAWDFIDLAEGELDSIVRADPQVICFGTLAQRGAVSRQSLTRLLVQTSGAEFFYDVNLRQSYWSHELVLEGVERATILKVNDGEADVLGSSFANRKGDIAGFCRTVLERYQRLKVVVVTMGSQGCMVCERGMEPRHIGAETVTVVDTVGAGDAFSAAFLTSWLSGKGAVESAAAGNRRGGWVAAHRGAIPET